MLVTSHCESVYQAASELRARAGKRNHEWEGLNKGRVARGSGFVPEANFAYMAAEPRAASVREQPFTVTTQSKCILDYWPRSLCRIWQLTEQALLGMRWKRTQLVHLGSRCKHSETGVYGLLTKRSLPAQVSGEREGE